MANITIELRAYLDANTSPTDSYPPQALITIDSNKFACSTDKMNLTLSNGYVELSVEGRNIYKYTVGDTFGGVAKTASEMFDSIRESYARA